MTGFYNIIHSCIRQQASAIPNTLKNVDGKNLDALQGKKLIFTGCGDSYAVADYGRWAFRQLDLDASVLSPSEVPLVPIRKDTVVIGVTASGRSVETIAALGYARKNGASTVVLTDDRDGRASGKADHIWETKSGVSTYNTSPSAPTTCAMAYLMKLSALQCGDTSSDVFRDIRQLENSCTNIVEWARGTGKELAAITKEKQIIYLISEGANYVAAQLGMMKFNEYSIIKGVSVLREEFRHHCNLSVKDGDPVILISDAPTDERDRTYIRVLSDTLKMKHSHLFCPESLQLTTPFGQAIANTIALQLAAYHSAKSVDPKKKGFRIPHAEAFKIY